MLTDTMKTLITNFSAAAVATVNENGTPSVSPKATVAILNDHSIVFGDIRSPGTIRNLKRSPAIELCFTDILARRAVRVTGTAEIIPSIEAGDEIERTYAQNWAAYRQRVRSFVKVTISAAELITSPAYDIGLSEADLRKTNLEKLNAL